jgi:hypothetical protein
MSSSLDSHKSQSSLISSDFFLLSIKSFISFDLLNVDKLGIITIALFLVSVVWISTHSSVSARHSSIVVVFLVSVVFAQHFCKRGNFTIDFSNTIEDNTIASLTGLTFFSTNVWFFSWLRFTETLLSKVRSNITTELTAMTFNPSVVSSDSLSSVISYLNVSVISRSLSFINRSWTST